MKLKNVVLVIRFLNLKFWKFKIHFYLISIYLFILLNNVIVFLGI